MLKTFKDKQGKKTVDNINNQNQSLGIGTRSIGSQGYVKPKIIRKKP